MKGLHALKLTIGFTCALGVFTAEACTRALYTGADNMVITGRSMDWAQDMGSEIWVLPRGIERNGQAGGDSPTWVAKYGSVVTTAYNIASADGMNEKGLVMNMLYLAESDYGQPAAGHPSLAISLWGQYVLDNFATVAEAVTALQGKPFYLLSPTLPNGDASTVHLSLSDTSGDSAIFEYIGGKLVVHHSKKFNVMTNSPVYSQQLALNTYWQSIGGTVFLPGTSRAADRFARASFFINAIPKALDKNFIQAVPDQDYQHQAVASVLGVIRGVSVPLGITTPNEPNIASTLWRTISDQKNRVYYFDSSTSPNVFWVDFQKLNFNKDTPVMKLDMAKGQIYSGEVSSALKASKAFKFLSTNNGGQ
jgi:penicillin V acylase-like amidase (Ntn superfamily)